MLRLLYYHLYMQLIGFHPLGTCQRVQRVRSNQWMNDEQKQQRSSLKTARGCVNRTGPYDGVRRTGPNEFVRGGGRLREVADCLPVGSDMVVGIGSHINAVCLRIALALGWHPKETSYHHHHVLLASTGRKTLVSFHTKSVVSTADAYQALTTASTKLDNRFEQRTITLPYIVQSYR